jgi:hypothetical protein
MNPTPPEIWLLPYAAWTGIGLAHPGRFWCHCRMVRAPSPCSRLPAVYNLREQKKFETHNDPKCFFLERARLQPGVVAER